MIYNCDYQLLLKYTREKKGARVQNRGREAGQAKQGGIFIWFWVLVIFSVAFV